MNRENSLSRRDVLKGVAAVSGAQEESAEEVKMPAATDLHAHGVTQDQIESLAETHASGRRARADCGGLVSSRAQGRNRLSRGVRICRYRIEAAVHNGRIASDRIGLQTLSGKRVHGPG